MRIGIFTESYEPIVNGVSVCVTTLRDELARRGHQVFIFAPTYKGYQDTFENSCRLPAVRTVLMRDYPFPVPYSPRAKKTFNSLNLDIVHTQTPFVLGVLGARWARRAGIPIVSTNHTLYTEYAHYVPVRPKTLTKAFLIKLMKWYYSRCDAVVVPSTPVEQRLRSYGIKTPIDVIKTGVVAISQPRAADSRKVRRLYGIGDRDFLLLYVGRIAREKNLRMLLRAFKMVLGDHSHAQLMLVGGGPATNETVRFAAELGLGANVIFAGMKQPGELDPLYGAADAFVFPSTTETQGIAICEALSAGLPVVAVNAGGIPENVEHGVDGFLTDDDPGQFADRISYLITHDRERAEMGAQARANACHFSIDRMVSDFERFYTSVVEGRKPPAAHTAEVA